MGKSHQSQHPRIIPTIDSTNPVISYSELQSNPVISYSELPDNGLIIYTNIGNLVEVPEPTFGALTMAGSGMVMLLMLRRRSII
ncbi:MULTISPECIES: hypothetical protein [unclassified Nostoc]|uniref:hypothetical protein n=1 Tax=unclassified Nostoc TaxID=2593658 RepID=UPI000B95B90A|nr:hypothetical protein [Nostoc sp. 'Peltigera membranacea cyanobiont' 232]